ncbi:MAG TPA: cysteine--tRNA ligase [Thermomicrobiales bacterium]|nr:cysteine--tRNA ligase [Thermomicrobiales bacterium]
MRLFNTQSGSLETIEFHEEPLGLYVCGVTPYDTTHAGHAFTYLTFDILIRYLSHLGQPVTYVQNVTDIDDDILRKSKEVGLTWKELGERETRRFLDDMASLHWRKPDYYVKATEHTPEMIAMIEPLIAQGLAYVSHGSVYFSVAADPTFGKLSHLPIAEMLPIANERGNFPDDPNKRDPLDFVLWQAAKPGEPTWDSPWGPGRPGWHIECSAMAARYLGPSFAIHGGGSDLIFPHHECEIAQAENATGVEPFVQHWVHVGMVGYQGEKMSKSLGNLVLVSNELKRFSPDAFRLYLFSHHYRLPWEYLDGEIDGWQQIAGDLALAIRLPSKTNGSELDPGSYREAFFRAMDEDLDTPTAIRALVSLADSIRQSSDSANVSAAQQTLSELGSILGLTFDA